MSYNSSQPRDSHGRWTSGGGGGSMGRINAGSSRSAATAGFEMSASEKSAVARQFGRVHNTLAHARHGAAQKASKGAYNISKDPTRGNMDPSVAYAAIGQKVPASRHFGSPTTSTPRVAGTHTIHSSHRRSR